ncbi:MAG: GTP pyrophosphokinase [Deltaproteobacteria bacterium]|nr:GTP pyrophosphokinase [Deltaproteobacteria bacterium]
MDKAVFCQEFNINEADLAKIGLDWDELTAIHSDHIQNQHRYAAAAGYVSERLGATGLVHSTKTRVKDPDHLIEKIIRKKLREPHLDITLGNYTQLIPDLAGVRALHLFKEKWQRIHDFIFQTWDLQKPPVANVCEGDFKTFIRRFKEKGCLIHKHPFGYRSVHYLVTFSPSKMESTIVEVQVRTLLEEAWSEIDHLIRYPYGNDKKALVPYLLFLNRLLGNADEMGSLIKLLNDHMENTAQGFESKGPSEGAPINYMRKDVQELPNGYRVKALLEERLKSLEAYLTSLKTMPPYDTVPDAFRPFSSHSWESHKSP